MNDSWSVIVQKFSSGNGVPVTRASVTREEFEALGRYISEASSKLDEQAPLIEKAIRDLAAGAIEVRAARNEVLRADTEARRAGAYALELREAAVAARSEMGKALYSETGVDRRGMEHAFHDLDAALAAGQPAYGSLSSDETGVDPADSAVTEHIPPMALPAMKAAAIEIIQKLDALAVKHDSYEYGLPMYDDGVMAELTLAVIEILHQHSSLPDAQKP